MNFSNSIYLNENDPKYAVDFVYPEEEDDTLVNCDEEFKQGAVKLIKYWEEMVYFIVNSKDSRAAAYAVAIALNFQSTLQNRTATEIATELGITKARISQLKKAFLIESNIINEFKG